jgi:hypothetical protein
VQNRTIEIEIDRDSVTEKFNVTTFEAHGKAIPAELILRSAYRTYRKIVFRDSPDVADPGIRIVRDSKSVIVQAADVVGNFAMSYAFMELGRPSKKITEKGQIFGRVFGDLIQGTDIKAMARLKGRDLELVSPGAVTLHIS